MYVWFKQKTNTAELRLFTYEFSLVKQTRNTTQEDFFKFYRFIDCYFNTSWIITNIIYDTLQQSISKHDYQSNDSQGTQSNEKHGTQSNDYKIVLSSDDS